MTQECVSALRSLQSLTATSGGRLYVGAVPGGLALADPQQAVLVLGPPRSGKTTALAIPNVLAAPGPCIVTSTKPDILAATLHARSGMGRCWLLDPTGATRPPAGVSRLRWSPVESATTWDESLVLARGLTGAARPGGRLGESAHWTERAEALLAPLLHAAHLEGGGMETVVRWVLRHDLDAPRSRVARHGVTTAADVLDGIAATDSREQSGIWSSAAGILAAYRSDAVLDNAAPANFDPRALHSTRDTVFVCAPARHQELVSPIVVTFLDQARSGCYAAWPGPGRAAPMTLVLDEVANIAPLPDLPALVSEGGSQGVITLACVQDLSQARSRWGPAADGFLSLFGTKVVLPGIADLATLDLVSRLGGEIDLPAQSRSYGPWWSASAGPTVTWSTHRQRRLPVEAVSQQPPGTALVISGSRPVESVGLRRWWELATFRSEAVLTPLPPGLTIKR
jgi:type IV secretory pathway TraG/TraD family ATPase VirD4